MPFPGPPAVEVVSQVVSVLERRSEMGLRRRPPDAAAGRYPARRAARLSHPGLDHGLNAVVRLCRYTIVPARVPVRPAQLVRTRSGRADRVHLPALSPALTVTRYVVCGRSPVSRYDVPAVVEAVLTGVNGAPPGTGTPSR
ncbi:MAG: hypothetical protein V7603_5517 [Micromonosporaceae bacterium]